MYRVITSLVLLCICATGSVSGQTPTGDANRKQPAAQTPPPAGAPEKLSDAELITRLQRSLEESEKRLNEIKAQLEDPQGEYAKAESEFSGLDKELEPKKKALQKLRETGNPDEVAQAEKEIENLQQRWKLAKNRFDLAITERKTLQEQVATLEQKTNQDREALNKLKAPPTTQPAAIPPPEQSPVSVPAAPQPEPAPSVQPPAVQPAPATNPPAANTPPNAAPATAPVSMEPAPSQELKDARKKAQVKEAEAQTAEEKLRAITERIDKARASLELAKTNLRTAYLQVENADETRRMLNDQVQKRSNEGAPQAELNELWGKISETRQRYRSEKVKVTQYTEEVEKWQEEVDSLQREYIEALEEAEAARKVAEDAQKELDKIKNPFAPKNLLKWSAEHGPRIGGILIGMFVLLWLARVMEKRIVTLMIGKGSTESLAERENRARTLVSVFHNAANLIVLIGGLLLLISDVGIDIVPLVGAAGVIGLAIAFGAQNLVRDYFSGFMILLENQYGINDVIKVGDIGGLVERITLRVTVLRGLDGTVHFIPNGQIEKVSNMTHGWSRALFEIGVAYKEDVDVVMKTLVHLGKELRADPTFCQLILDDPEMLGVDEFGDSAVVIKFFMKTRPLQQWTVKRAMLRRIKKKFDELGIEIPFPHRTVYHRYEEGETPPEQFAAPPGPVV